MRYLIVAGTAVLIIIAGVVFIAYWDGHSNSTKEPIATVDPDQHIIFHNGNILTINPDQPQVEAIAIVGQKIEMLGSNDEVLALKNANTKLVDLRGRTMMPGFVDAHSHIFNDSETYLDMSLEEVQRAALENGITTLGNMYTDESWLKRMRSFDEEGQLAIRTNLYLVATDNCGRPQGDWYTDYQPTNTPGELLRIGGVKVFADGGTCDRPALSYELRSGEGLGDLFFNQEELNDLVKTVQDAGYQVAIHAIGDRAIDQAQEAIERALDGAPNTYRHRIEHNSVIRPDQIARYGEIGIIPVIFGQYPNCEPFGPPPPPEYQSWEWPYRDLLDTNPDLQAAWHGDDPFFGRIRPLDDLYSLVTRNEVGIDGQICEGPEWLKDQTIPVAEALKLMTHNAAYALFRDQEVGSLEVGKFADVIVLSEDPSATAPENIPGIDVWMTMVGGQTAFCEASQEWLCP